MTPTPRLALVLRNGFVLTIFLEGMHRAGLPEGLFLALAILVVLEADFGGGVIAGRERMLGSLLGHHTVAAAHHKLRLKIGLRCMKRIEGR